MHTSTSACKYISILDIKRNSYPAYSYGRLLGIVVYNEINPYTKRIPKTKVVEGGKWTKLYKHSNAWKSGCM